jgi:hypothetical protein
MRQFGSLKVRNNWSVVKLRGDDSTYLIFPLGPLSLSRRIRLHSHVVSAQRHESPTPLNQRGVLSDFRHYNTQVRLRILLPWR